MSAGRVLTFSISTALTFSTISRKLAFTRPLRLFCLKVPESSPTRYQLVVVTPRNRRARLENQQLPLSPPLLPLPHIRRHATLPLRCLCFEPNPAHLQPLLRNMMPRIIQPSKVRAQPRRLVTMDSIKRRVIKVWRTSCRALEKIRSVTLTGGVVIEV